MTDERQRRLWEVYNADGPDERTSAVDVFVTDDPVLRLAADIAAKFGWWHEIMVEPSNLVEFCEWLLEERAK